MYCSRCGTKNDDDARFCEKCGADLTAMPKPSVPAAPPAAPAAPAAPPPGAAYPPPGAGYPPPPYAYPPAQRRAWWYPIGVWVILSGFFLFVDLVMNHTVTWSVWPVGILGIFMVGFPLLHLLEERSTRPR